MGDSADKHADELQALKESHSKHGKDLDEHHATVQERIKYLEKSLGDSADKHTKELKALAAAHDKHASDLSGIQAVHAAHASLPERMDYMEKLLGDSADKHTLTLQALQDAHAKFQASHGKTAKDLETMKVLQAHHATMGERVDYLEQTLGDSADKHAEEVAALKAAHAKTQDALAKQAKDASAALAHHATVGERLAYIEKCIGDSADQQLRELEALKQAHSNTAKDLTSMKDLHGRLSTDNQMAKAKQMSVAERLDLLEGRLKHCFEGA
mmetsp:Transcript_83133/g.211624  ORF Transcript_83133/g.211624 Transcript_83133/m.211624 type:complete len:270 (+) Transcript_83133:3-812(+)